MPRILFAVVCERSRAVRERVGVVVGVLKGRRADSEVSWHPLFLR